MILDFFLATGIVFSLMCLHFYLLFFSLLQAATSAPLIERSIERATGIVYNITGGKDLTLAEVNRVSEVVTSMADPSANVIFGAVIDDQYEGEIHVTIIATGFSQTFEENLLSGRVPVSAVRTLNIRGIICVPIHCILTTYYYINLQADDDMRPSGGDSGRDAVGSAGGFLGRTWM